MNTGKWKRWTSVLVIMILIVSGLVPYAAAYDEYTVITEETETEITEDETGEPEALPEAEADEADATLTEETEVWNDEDPAEEPADAIVDSPVTEEEITEDSTLTTEDIAEVEAEADTTDEPEESVIEPETELDTEDSIADDEESLDEEQLEEITAVMETLSENSFLLVANTDARRLLSSTNAVGSEITIETIDEALSTASSFNVFANYYKNYAHVEGTVAAYQLYGSKSQFGMTEKVTANSSNYRITVTKEASGTGKQGTFRFAVYAKVNGNFVRVSDPASIQTDENGYGLTTLTGSFGNYPELYVFEVDPSSNSILENGTQFTVNGVTYTVGYDRETAIVKNVSKTNDNYIQTFQGNDSQNDMLNQNSGNPATLYIGSGYNVTEENGGQKRITGSGADYFVGANGSVEVVNGAFPIDFDQEFTKLNDFSKKLATAQSTAGVTVVNMKASSQGFWKDAGAALGHPDDQNYIVNTGFGSVDENGYLIVNVDCTDVDAYKIERFSVNGQSTSNYTCPYWDRIIFNFYKKSGSNIVSYTGNVQMDDSAGIFLAPAATVTRANNILGSVIADRIEHTDGEIHAGMTDAHVKTVTGSVKCTNVSDENSTPKIGVFKVDSEKVADGTIDPSQGSGNNGKGLAGATLVIKDASGTVIETFESGKDVEYFELPEGSYILSEVEAPSGYGVADDIRFSVTDKGELKVVIGEEEHICEYGILMMQDTPIKNLVKVRKVNENNEPLNGAGLKITDSEDAVVEEFTTDGFDHEIPLRAGEYTLRETSAPEGYAIAEPIVFTVTANGTVEENGVPVESATIVMTDELKPDIPEVKVKKTDPNGNLISGATLEIQDLQGKAVADPIVTDGVNVTTLELPAGTYKLVETNAPNDYQKADPVEFTVLNNGDVYVNGDKKADATVVMVDYPKGRCSLLIYKTVNYKEGNIYQWTVWNDNDLSSKLIALGNLYFEIDGPNGYHKIVYYKDFQPKYSAMEYLLEDLVPGQYTVTERNPEIDGQVHKSVHYYVMNDYTGATPNQNNETNVVTLSETGHSFVSTSYYGIVGWDKKIDNASKVWVDNQYESSDLNTSLGATKRLDGGQPAKGQFSFTLEPDASNPNAPMPQGSDQKVYTATNEDDGAVDFGTITFEKKSETYKYVIKEKLPVGINTDTENPVYDGIVYDTSTYYAVVTVSGRGQNYKTSVKYTDKDGQGIASSKPIFTNKIAVGSLTLQKVNGQDGLLEAVRDGSTTTIYDEVAFEIKYKRDENSSLETYVNPNDLDGYWRPDLETGLIKLENLKPGIYEISEVESPEDYMDLPGTIKIQVTGNGTVKRLEAPSNYVHWKDENIDNPNDTTSVKYTSNTEVTGKTLLVRNYPNINMPETGRNSRWYCFLFGSLITLAGIILLFTGRGNRNTPDLEGSAGGGFRA